ncbi:HAD family hydrolase [Yimella sp. cx-51]|uniref:HAD family hydrolase n=1 Tax=Yimella sp. cx-51 TaxID=2770551 RepID=UPI00165E1148|nr:HAD-IIIA family hydrolase [Yimella sp. cx-51]MBC9956408.1 HAD-IIIA family hydrolase [Yimella sp. cx-51]QTH38474.1 HAD-IIIA family hydrolase [Yimella sp. cx-51]
MLNPFRPVVLFDFDGTLADTIPLIVESYHHTLRASALPPVDEVEVRSWIGRPLQPVFEERYPGRGAELTATYRDWNLAHHDELIVRVDGMPQLLKQLVHKGVRVGVVSSKRRSTVEQGLRVVALAEYIDVLVGMDETTAHKPDPAPLLFAAEVLAVDPSQCVYVGDADVDVLAAKAAGMASIAVTWGAGTADVLQSLEPDALVRDVTELERVLLPSG